MVQFIAAPQWFYGTDLLLDLFSLLIVFFVGLLAFRFYRFSRSPNYLALSVSFFLISASFLAKIATYIPYYYHIFRTVQVGANILTYQVSTATDLLYPIGYFLFHLLMLVGLYYLFVTLEKRELSATDLIVLYLILMLTFLANATYYVFHLTALIMLALISWRFNILYRRTGNRNTIFLIITFVILTLSQLCFVLSNYTLYVVAEFLQIVGYIFLLIVLVLTYGKKKGKNRHN